jgi:thiol-disulfide isomerase/thioredoxin
MTPRLPLLCGLAVLALAACQRNAAPPNAAPPPAPQAAASAAQPSQPAVVQQTATTPTLRVTALDGKTFDLAAHRGHWVVVNFWATWCGPCLKEMPELSALDAMREQVDVIGLAYEDTTPEEMRAFLQKHPVVYPIAIIGTYAPPKDFETPRGLPTTWLIAPDGTVAHHFLGPVSARDVDAVIAAGGAPKAG